jgi:Ran GTPase-activating protein (RanGAP) involved in mRNA processing and transport
MKNKNLLVLDFNIDLIKNNPTAICLINKNNIYQYLKDILISPGSVFSFKDIKIYKDNNLNLINMEFIGNYLNPYDHIKLSLQENLKFDELHVDNQKNKFLISQDKIIEYFSEAIKYNKSIKNLDISSNQLNEILFSKLYKCLKNNSNIIHLNLSNNSIGENSAIFLNEIINTNIFMESLIIKNIYLKDKGLKIIEHTLKENKTLKILDISSNYFTFESAEILGNIIKKNNMIDNLNISGNKIFQKNKNTSENFFNSFEKNNTINSISFNNCLINKSSLISLIKSLRKNNGLISLDIGNNKFDENEICEIWDELILGDFNFKKLFINQIGKITAKIGIKIFEFLRKNNQLDYINISKNLIVEEALVYIFDGLKENKNLKEIDIRDNLTGLKVIYLFGHYLLGTSVNLKKIWMKGNFNNEEMIKVDFTYLKDLIQNKYIETDINNLILK